jgi:glutamate-1-semialdehyde 2,1-aminomutase
VDGLTKAAHDLNVKFSAQSVGGMFGIYFSEKAPTSFDEIMKSNKEYFNQFFHHMLTAGFYFGPSAFEAGFVSQAHSDNDIHQTIEAAKEVFRVLK